MRGSVISSMFAMRTRSPGWTTETSIEEMAESRGSCLRSSSLSMVRTPSAKLVRGPNSILSYVEIVHFHSHGFTSRAFRRFLIYDIK